MSACPPPQLLCPCPMQLLLRTALRKSCPGLSSECLQETSVLSRLQKTEDGPSPPLRSSSDATRYTAPHIAPARSSQMYCEKATREFQRRNGVSSSRHVLASVSAFTQGA